MDQAASFTERKVGFSFGLTMKITHYVSNYKITNLKFQSKYESLPITKWSTEQQIISNIADC